MLNGLNAGAAGNVFVPEVFRELIAMSNLRNIMQGGDLRDAYHQGFIEDAVNTVSLLIGRKHVSGSEYSIALEGMSKQMFNDIPFTETATGAAANRTTRKYMIFALKNAAPRRHHHSRDDDPSPTRVVSPAHADGAPPSERRGRGKKVNANDGKAPAGAPPGETSVTFAAALPKTAIIPRECRNTRSLLR